MSVPKTFCTECGAPLLRSDRFCTGCGTDVAAQTTQSAVTTPTVAMSIEVKEARTSRVPLVIGAIATTVVLIAVGSLFLMRPGGTPSTSRAAAPSIAVPTSSPRAPKPTVTTAPQTRAPRPVVTVTRTAPAPTTPQVAQAPVDGPTGDGPDSALSLTKAQARSELSGLRDQDVSRLDDLYYSWVPQLSSKCEGWTVDIKPNWSADGVPETNSVTAQQILAFHTALAQRYGAVLVKDTDVGRGGSVPCPGTIWLALGSDTFNSAGAANRWCDRQGFPVDECFARRVVPAGEPGGTSKTRD